MPENPAVSLKAVLYVVIAILVVPVSFMVFIDYAWRDKTPRGILHDRFDWPEPVQQLEQAVGLPGTIGQGFEVYLLDGQPRSTLSEVMCRTKFREQVFQRLQAELKLQPANDLDNVPLRSRLNSCGLADEWWPKQNAAAQYFVCQQTHQSDEGPLFKVAIDRQSNRIFIHYWFNF